MKILTESMKNIPSWVTKRLPKHIIMQLTTGYKIDLHNCEFTEVNDLRVRDPRWKDKNLIFFYLLPDGQLYIPGILDAYPKDGSNITRQWLINNAEKIGCINISESRRPNKDSYTDPRYKRIGIGNNRHTKYAGQYEYDGEWYQSSGRDKSGYEIPDPAKLVGKLYNMNFDNYSDVLNRYYKKLLKIKDEIFNIDISNSDTTEYGRALSSYGDAVRNYRNLLETMEKFMSKKHSQEELDFYADPDNEDFLPGFHDKTNLDKQIQYTLKSINKLK